MLEKSSEGSTLKAETTASRPSKSEGAKTGKSAKAGGDVVTAIAKVKLSREEVIADYRVAYLSRQASLIGRKEVLTGKAKFGIFGDGKEIPQLALARAFKEGDVRSGYYRDQTFMFAAGLLSVEQFFAQLYADTDVDREPASAGRGMNCHFGTRMLDENGAWRSQIDVKNSSSDISPTGGQMARLLGLAYASKLYRNEPALSAHGGPFSRGGNEVAFGTIGDASTSEGIFWETLNAAGVLQVPLVMSVWDDGYGISVPREHQTCKGSISEALKGFQREGAGKSGFEIHTVKGWDYLACVDTYALAVGRTREEHVPALVHVQELTQPQGHSTSGSHERYKSKERLAWEEDHCCLRRMKAWMVSQGFATLDDFESWEAEDRKAVETARSRAWEAYNAPLKSEREEALAALSAVTSGAAAAGREALATRLGQLSQEVRSAITLNRKSVATALTRAVFALRGETFPEAQQLRAFESSYLETNRRRYNSHLHSESSESPLLVEEVKPVYSDASEVVDGRVVLLRCFDKLFERDPRVFALGEDVGKLGDVNLVFEGLSAKFGDLRVTDTGIREATILGQGLGAAMRGLRPLVDIQYLDYLLYALQIMSDDLATLHYRTRGGQKAPVIVRTKGHRLEGIWHTGSPIGMILNALRGMYVCVPRNCVQAAGLYNTLTRGDNPALVIEVLNGYRLKERVPDNVGEFRVPLGVPEVLREGGHITIVTYGACVRVAQEAAEQLAALDISAEIVDVQTLLPFDLTGVIGASIRKTNAVLFLDEDVPGGASAYMMQQVLDNQDVWDHLDAPPRCLAAVPNRSPYATDGDYFSKPNAEDVVTAAYEICRVRNARAFPGMR
jgi:pyruvate/2-oxoglutarate/acetoin dehydrogenase E1 component/TPP-dependent pyruvate/acetoin dehydrogenase alpha subunit